ncbi:MAG: O-antigen ligase family protein [Candidatus Omnitrophica bacterium]|nr:O-antigen ligase family protein [Candidatus Omnitrophota bacterium]MCM8802651.1 O-antigen ligase family protein [Candidatus Omnitrophota bacterium]
MKKKEKIDRILAYIICLLTFFRFFFDGITYPGFNLILFISLFLLFTFIVFLKFNELKINYAEFFLFLFFIFSLISSSISEIKGTGVRYNAYIGSCLLLFFLVRNLIKNKEKEILINTILLCIFVITLYGIYQRFWGLEATRRYLLENKDFLNQYPEFLKYFSPTFLDRSKSNRIFSTFIYPNIYANFLISLMPVLFFIFLEKYRSFYGIFSILLFFLSFLNLLLTESVGGLLIFLFIFHIILLQIILDKKTFKNTLPIILVFEFLIIFLGYKFNLLPHIHSLMDRMIYWKSSAKIIRFKPFLGVGPENFRYYFLKFKPPEGLETLHAHNFLIETLIENGMFGLILLSLFIWNVFVKISIDKKEKILNISIFYLLLSFILHNMVDFGFYDPSLGFLFFLFAGLGIDKTKNNVDSKRLTKFLLCLIIIITGFSIFKLIKFENSERYRKRCNKVFNFEEKLYLLERAERFYNKNFEVYFEKGNLYINMWQLTGKEEDLKKSILSYKKSIYLNPYFTKGYRHLAYIYELTDNYKQAEEMYLKVLECYPNKKLYNLEISRFYKKIGNEEKYKIYYNKSKELKDITIEEKIFSDEVEKWIKLH